MVNSLPPAGALIQAPQAEVVNHENLVAGGRGFKGAGRGSGGAGSISGGGATHVSPQVCSRGLKCRAEFSLNSLFVSNALVPWVVCLMGNEFLAFPWHPM